jgi:hypothetical protein
MNRFTLTYNQKQLPASIHDELVEQITKHISSTIRCAIVVTGAILTGKKSVCQRAAGLANMIPYLHVSDESLGFVQLAQTIATWFKYVENDEVKTCAFNVLCHLEKNRWSRAHDDCITLVNLAIGNGLQACFLVDRIQLLDDFSLSLIRECLHGKSRRHRSFNGRNSDVSSHHSSLATQSEALEESGKICFLCVHVSLYSYKSAEQLVNDITRSHKALNIPIVTVGEVTADDLRAMAMQVTGLAIADRGIKATALASGYCVGYFAERQAAYRNISSRLWSEGKRGFIDMNNKLEWTVPPGSLREVLVMPVMQVCGEVAMRFSYVFDVLPPLFQTFCKVLAIASRTRFFNLSKVTMWNVLNDLIADGVEHGLYNVVIDEMIEMHLLKVELQDSDDVLSFQCPALGDIAFDVCTPVQVKSIGKALIERLEPYKTGHFAVPFVIANLHDLVGDEYEIKEALWIEGYNSFKQESSSWDTDKVVEWKEKVSDEIRALGCKHPIAVMGEDAAYQCCFVKNSISETMKLLKQYHSPIAIGPMGLSLSVITVNVYFSCGEYFGFSQERVAQVRNDLLSGCTRYMREVDVIERYLSLHGCDADIDMLHNEQKLICEMQLPSNSMIDVEQKASILYDIFIPTHVVHRIGRIHLLVHKLRGMETPSIIHKSDKTMLLAYEALKASKLDCDMAQDAIMIMSTRNWKTKPIPEYLPSYHLQTLVRIRNKVLKQLSDTELLFWKHRQAPIDLEAFLVISSLIYEAQESGEC